MGAPHKTLVGTVGYHNQGDLTAGPLLLPWLAAFEWPAGVEVEDLSYDPIAVVHRLTEITPPFARLVLAGAMDRAKPGAEIAAYRWRGVLPPPDEVQNRVGEALSGVLDLENLLVITQQFGALPAEVWVVEVQPVDIRFGPRPSRPVAAALPAMARLTRHLATASGEELAAWQIVPAPTFAPVAGTRVAASAGGWP